MNFFQVMFIGKADFSNGAIQSALNYKNMKQQTTRHILCSGEIKEIAKSLQYSRQLKV